MRPQSAGALSGCVVWLITFGLLSICLFPVSMILAGFAPIAQPETVAGIYGPLLCPEGTTGEIHTYATTSIDDQGFETPATGYELNCVNASGEVVENLGASFGFILMGSVAAASLLAAVLLAFLFAAPVGLVVARVFPRREEIGTPQGE